jgi:hypothetical protein
MDRARAPWIVEQQGVARLAGRVASLDGLVSALGAHADHPPVDLADDELGPTAEGDLLEPPREPAIGHHAVSGQGGQAEPFDLVEAADMGDAGGENGVGHGQGQGMESGQARHREQVLAVAAEAARRLGHKQTGEGRIVHRAPQFVEGSAVAAGEVGEQPVGHLGDQGKALAHLSPSPLAMMPRRISRVPPRREKDGETCSKRARQRAKSVSSQRST